MLPFFGLLISFGFRETLNFLSGFSTVSRGLTNSVGSFRDSSTSSVISRSNSAFNYSRRVIGTRLAGVMTGVTLGFTDTWCVLEWEPLYPKPSLQFSKKSKFSLSMYITCCIIFSLTEEPNPNIDAVLLLETLKFNQDSHHSS